MSPLNKTSKFFTKQNKNVYKFEDTYQAFLKLDFLAKNILNTKYKAGNAKTSPNVP